VCRRACGDRLLSGSRLAGLTEFPRCGNNAPVIHVQRYFSLSGVLLLSVAVGLAPGCTLLGDAFLPDQPKAEVTVVGSINIDSTTAEMTYFDPVARTDRSCSAGSALFSGIARNTGDQDVVDVTITIVALDANNAVLDTYHGYVYNGNFTPADPDTGAPLSFGTSLDLDQSGNFAVCARLSAGSVASTTYRTQFTVIEAVK